MSKTRVIAKGKYVRPHSDIAVEVDRYVIAREKGSRFILLKLRNKKNVTLSGVTVTINQFDADGNPLGTVREEVPADAAKGRFVLTRKIAVDPACVDFTADIDAAEYGNYRYTCAGGGVVLDYTGAKKPAVYNASAEKRKLKGRDISVKARKFRPPVAVYLLAAVLLACLAVLTWFQLDIFTQLATGFRSSGVEYTFSVDKYGEYDGVYVSGYAGKSSSVTIPATASGYEVLGIGEEAFKGNKTIKEVKIESSVDISDGAFYGCTRLKTVSGGSVISIGDYAFYGCTSLESVSSDNAVTIGDYAFYNCSSLEYVSMSEEASSVGDYAFSGCSSLTLLLIPETVTYLGESVLEGCASLETLTLPYLDGYLSCVFGGASYYDARVPSTLSNLTIYGKTTLLRYAFYQCSGLKYLTFSGTSSSIGNYAFSGCYNLVSVTFTGDSLRIEDHAFFNCSNFKTLDTSASITYIGDYAFTKTQISEIDLSSASYIGISAFSNTSLKQANMGSNINLKEIGELAFYSCPALVYVSIPSGVTQIYASTFAYCTSLATVQLGTALTIIGSNAFSGCSSLTSLVIPSTVTSIGSGILSGCSSLQSLTLPYLDTYLNYYFGGNMYSSSAVPSSLEEVNVTGGTSIPNYAFYYCGSVKTVTLAEDITSLGAYSFYYCMALEDIALPDTLESIETYAFTGCSSLKTLDIPENVSYLGSGFLSGCNSLESLTLPYIDTYLSSYFGGGSYYSVNTPSTLAEVTIIGGSSVPQYAFYCCSGLRTVSLGESITSIGQYAFYGCSSLENIEIPSTVKSIGGYAFMACRNLKSIEIPSNTRSFGSYVFDSCYRLYEIGWLTSYLTCTYEYIGSPYSNALNIYYDTADKMQRETSGGYEFALAPEGSWYLVDVPDSETYELPESFVTTDNAAVTEYNIPAYLFYGSEAVTVYIPASVKEIKNYAFYQSSSLKEVYFAQGSSLTQLEDYTFSACSALTYIEIPDSLESIGTGAFENCLSLKSITLPQNLYNIGSYAFEGCYRLREVYNDSTLPLEKGADTYGKVARYALVIYQSGVTSSAVHTTIDGIEMIYDGQEWYVVGAEDSVTTLNLGDMEYNGQAITSYKIASYAFYQNSNITSVTLGSAVSEIAEYSFYNASALRTLDMSASSIETIRSHAFSYCYGLSSVKFPAALESIEEFAFNYCYNITSLDFSGTALKTIGADAFYYDYAVKQVLFSSSLESIGDYAFAYCTAITSLDFSGTALKTIGGCAFTNDSALTSVTFSGVLETIGNAAFESCSALTALDFPASLNYIGYNAFNNNQSLAKVTLRSYVDIRDSAFYGCTALYEVNDLVYIGITKGSSDNGYAGYYAVCVFNSEESGGLVYSGNWIFAYYDDAWRLVRFNTDNYSTVEMPESFTDNYGNAVTSYEIADGVFSGKSMGYVIIPESVTYIDPGFADGAYNTWWLYYKGTEDKYAEIGGSAIGITVSYYAECVHESYRWTYSSSGSLITGMAYREEVTQEATCTQEGSGYHVCAYCGERLETYTIDKASHTPGEDGTCTVCGASGVSLTEDNLDSNGYITVSNDSSYPFDIEGGVFTSTNNSASSATITFTATQDVTVYIKTQTSFANSNSYGYLNVKRLSSGNTGYGLGYNATSTYSFDLKAGESITITVYKQSTSTSAGVDNCLYILQFLIYG